MRTYDVIVAGLGAAGSAAAAEAAARGARVLGLERFARGHALASHHGRTRITRLAYFEHPDYVPLLRRAWARWRELEAEADQTLLVETGGVYAGPPDDELVAGSLASAREHGLEVERLTSAEVRERFPALRLGEGMAAVFERQAGLLIPERCVAAQLDRAERAGAALRFEEPALEWSADGSGIRVRTASGEYAADRLILAAGAWTDRLVADLALPLRVERVPLHWFEPADPASFARLPVYILSTEDGHFYGFPYLADQGLKVARHGDGDLTDPDALDRGHRPADEQRVRRFIRRYLPGGDGRLRESTVCMYTRTPDGHFIIDRHPRDEQVVIASPCSGHGFKFASAVGEILADLALTGRTQLPIGLFALSRFRV